MLVMYTSYFLEHRGKLTNTAVTYDSQMPLRVGLVKKFNFFLYISYFTLHFTKSSGNRRKSITTLQIKARSGHCVFYFVASCLSCPWINFTSCSGVSVIICLLCPITCTFPVHLNHVCPLSISYTMLMSVFGGPGPCLPQGRVYSTLNKV